MGLDYDLLITRLFAEADKKRLPLSGAFELTSRCTLDCKMCYIHRKENDCEAMKLEKDTAWWLRLTEQARDAGMFMLLLTGGEPLLRRDFDEIYLSARKCGLLVSLNTNGTLIDEKRVDFFVANPPHRLNVTLYGASEETYGALCGNGAAYERVVSAITRLKQAGINLKLNCTATQYNRHDVEKIYEFAREQEIPVQTVTYMFPPVRSGARADRLPPEEAARLHFRCRMADPGEEKFRQHLQAKSRLGRRPDPSGRMPCRAGKSTFWVTWDGRMTPCGMMTEPSAEITDFSRAWDSIKRSSEAIVLPPECAECEYRSYCDMCAAVAMAETGRADGVPVYACKKAAAYKALCEQLVEPRDP